MHRFVILIDGELRTYSSFDDIPPAFDNLIEFRPHVPDGPHTEDDHSLMEGWNDKLQHLIKRETK